MTTAAGVKVNAAPEATIAKRVRKSDALVAEGGSPLWALPRQQRTLCLIIMTWE